MRLQSEIVWGTGTSKTVEVEIDATVVAKWRCPVVSDGRCLLFEILPSDTTSYDVSTLRPGLFGPRT